MGRSFKDSGSHRLQVPHLPIKNTCWMGADALPSPQRGGENDVGGCFRREDDLQGGQLFFWEFFKFPSALAALKLHSFSQHATLWLPARPAGRRMTSLSDGNVHVHVERESLHDPANCKLGSLARRIS